MGTIYKHGAVYQIEYEDHRPLQEGDVVRSPHQKRYEPITEVQLPLGRAEVYVGGHKEPAVENLDPFPDYLREEAQRVVKRVQELNGTTSFGFLTDFHYAACLDASNRIRLRRTLNTYRALQDSLSLDVAALGGDYTFSGDKRYKKESYREFRAELDGIRYFPVVGNHDNNPIWDKNLIFSEKSENVIFPEELYVLLFNHLPALGAHFHREHRGLYYYWDNPDIRVRYIFLDNQDIPFALEKGALHYNPRRDYAYSQYQLDWLTKTALHLDEEGWTVVLFTHIPPIPELSKENLSRLSPLHEILLACKNQTACRIDQGEGDFVQKVDVDFSIGAKVEVAAVFAGHNHEDRSCVKDGIPYILTANAAMLPQCAWVPRIPGTAGEVLFDIVTLDTKAHKVFLTRVGAGEDRIFEY
jgi:predicted MPP superfamily phosphohydrolase